MEKIFSTADVHARNRLDYWHEIACKRIVPHLAEPESVPSFRAEIEVASLADVGLAVFDASPMGFTHTERHAASSQDEVIVCRQMTGLIAFEQESRQGKAESGDIFLLDPRKPYVGHITAVKMLVLKVQRRALEARIGNIRDVVARPIRPVNAESALASSFLAMLPAHSAELGVTAGQVVMNHTLDLLAVAISKTMELGQARLSSAKSLRLTNLLAAIDSRLSDPDIDLEAVARAAGVSVRYANALLAEENTSLGRTIQARRLARCRKCMDDPAQARRTLSDIAFAWGFSDMTHFSRVFKKMYGLLPSEYRRLSPAERFNIVAVANDAAP